MGDRRVAYRILVVRPEGKRPPGIPRHRWEDKIKWRWDEVMNLIDLAQDGDTGLALVNAVMSLRFP